MADPLHILVVDDNLREIDLLREAARGANCAFEMHSAPSASEAFAWLGRQPPFADAPTADLILLDLRMPVMPGTQILRLIRTDSRWAPIPVVVVTSVRSASERELCIGLGALDYLIKPTTVPDSLAFARTLAGHIRNVRDQLDRDRAPYA